MSSAIPVFQLPFRDSTEDVAIGVRVFVDLSTPFSGFPLTGKGSPLRVQGFQLPFRDSTEEGGLQRGTD